jgi:chromatin segregation and condensation protein Rec8/ScpA/Scc1 (kleisin family)
VEIIENPEVEASSAFQVHLDNFDGPFDLLLQLISRHKLDITEISLSLVTDEFIAYIRALEVSGEGWRLDQATEFLVIAATLLDLKAARLLPSGEIEDEEDLALLEARDILFARLLQYRAFKEIAASFQEAIAAAETSATGNVVVFYKTQPTEIEDSDDETELPAYIQKYVEYGTAERALRANTDGRIESLADYWGLRKKAGYEAIKKWKRLKLSDRDLQLRTRTSSGIGQRPKYPRLPSTYADRWA